MVPCYDQMQLHNGNDDNITPTNNLGMYNGQFLVDSTGSTRDSTHSDCFNHASNDEQLKSSQSTTALAPHCFDLVGQDSGQMSPSMYLPSNGGNLNDLGHPSPTPPYGQHSASLYANYFQYPASTMATNGCYVPSSMSQYTSLCPTPLSSGYEYNNCNNFYPSYDHHYAPIGTNGGETVPGLVNDQTNGFDFNDSTVPMVNNIHQAYAPNANDPFTNGKHSDLVKQLKTPFHKAQDNQEPYSMLHNGYNSASTEDQPSTKNLELYRHLQSNAPIFPVVCASSSSYSGHNLHETSF